MVLKWTPKQQLTHPGIRFSFLYMFKQIAKSICEGVLKKVDVDWLDERGFICPKVIE